MNEFNLMSTVEYIYYILYSGQYFISYEILVVVNGCSKPVQVRTSHFADLPLCMVKTNNEERTYTTHGIYVQNARRKLTGSPK